MIGLSSRVKVPGRPGVGLVALAVAALSILMAPGPSSAQEPGPVLEITARIELEDTPRQYDLVQMLVEFAPGASNASHRVNGRALFTVLSGELTRIEEGGETTVFTAGQSFSEVDSDDFDVEVNKGTAPARLLATFLLQPGAPPIIIHPDATPPPAGPKGIAAARTTVGTIPAKFALAHGIIATAAGGVAPPHTHDGWQLVTTLEGNPVARLDGVVQTGATFVDRPGVVHDGRNPGPGVARLMFASLTPAGSPPARPVASTGTQPRPIQPPSTGDGGLARGR
jgi:quercetin dioxygenase-like cupin family protein